MTPPTTPLRGCLPSLLRIFGLQPSPKTTAAPDLELPESSVELPYRLRDDFLSPAEHSFYLVLKNMMGEHFTICPKVSLSDIFFVIRPNENMSAYNRINRKHIDFLICAPKTMQPMFAIELDDSSHTRSDRVERDEFVEKVFEIAQLPLVRVPHRPSYSTTELGPMFKEALQMKFGQAGAEPSEPLPKSAPTGSSVEPFHQPPFCPKCGVPMLLRTARTGQQAGRQFYGCPNYPRCRVILPAQQES